MNKSTNMEKQVCWGWDGVYDYPDMRQYYKRLADEEIERQLKDEEESNCIYSHPYFGD